MKKRFWSLLLVFSMAFCLLLPVGASALERGRGEECFAFLKNDLLKNGKPDGGVFTYSGVESSDDTTFNITASYDPRTDQLRFGVSRTLDPASYSAEIVVPASLEMPYDASQHLSYVDVFDTVNEGKIGADFTTESQIPLSGNTYDTEKIFPYAIALALRHAQDKLLYGSGYTIADLGFTALFEELYGNHTHVATTNNAVAATCTEAGYSGDRFCAVCGEPMGAGKVVPALGHKGEVKNAKPATETAAGYTGDEVCARCGKLLKKGEEIPVLEPKACDGGKDCPSKIFTDVNQALWYHLPIDWAVTNKVTTGLTPTTFGPNASCTRAQMVTFLWRAVGEPEPKSASNPFVDVPAGQYYAKAVLWALENGITTGIDAAHFAPNNTVTRAQTVTFLWRLKHEPAPTGSQSFPDVPAGQYYAKAVMWAVENNVTNGMGNGLFAPNDNCTRAQIVTFLYRAVHA